MANYTRFRLRGDTKANWLSVNPILAKNEPAIETDTNRFKIGDGVSTYSQLSYGRNTVEYSSLYNVTSLFPLPSGFYEHSTAILAIPSGERTLGLIITYETASGVWYTERFIGTNVSGWTTVSNWERLPNASDVSRLDSNISNTNSHIANKSNPHEVTKSQVGLSNVDNTSDIDKPISTLQQAAITATTNAFNGHVANTSNPHSVTKSQVGLSNVDNTSDSNKPISSATQTALNGKVNNSGNEAISGIKTFSSSPIVPTPTSDGEATNKAYVDEAVNEINSDLNEVKEKASIINNAGSGEKFLSDDGTYKSMAEATTEGSIHIGAIEDVTDEHLINIDPSGEFVEAVSKTDFDVAVNTINDSISLLNSSISDIQMQSARKISIYFQQNGLSVSPDGVNGSLSVADCWRPYLIDCSKNKLEENRLVGELQRNNFFRYVDGSFAPSICITDVQKAECDVELYLDSNATTKYCNAGAFNPVSFYNQYGVNQKLYNISGDEVRVLRPWESTNTDYSIVIATTKDMWFIDNEIGSSGRVWKGVFSNPTTWDGIDATKLSRTGLSPGASTTIGGKFRNRFFLYNTGDINTVSSKGRENLFTAFYKPDRSFPRTNDVSQLTAATFARANNYDTSKPYPFSEIGMFAYTCFVSSHEIKHNTKALHDPNIFSSGISSNDRANNFDEFLNYGGVRYSTDGGLTYIYSLWYESKGLYFTSVGNTTFMSEFLNIQWPKEQCMEAQMALSYACELNIPENTEFEFYGETYYYRTPNGVVSLLDGEMNARLYKKVNQTISCFDSAGSPITANVECILRIPIIDGFNLCGDVSRYIPGGCEIVGVRNNQEYGTDLPYSVYLETDQTKFIYETAIYKGINETFDFQHIYKKLGNYSGFNGFRKSLAPFTFLGGESGGSILTGECAAIEGRDAWSSSVNQIGRMASKQGSHARLSAIGPRFAYITNAASYAVRNVGSSMQVLL